MSFELTDEERRAWRWCIRLSFELDKKLHIGPSEVVARALRKTLARALKAEYWQFQLSQDRGFPARHDWTDADWLAAAERELRGKK